MLESLFVILAWMIIIPIILLGIIGKIIKLLLHIFSKVFKNIGYNIKEKKNKLEENIITLEKDLRIEWGNIMLYENELESTYPYRYKVNEIERFYKLKNLIIQRYKKELEENFSKMKKNFITRKHFNELNEKNKKIIKELKIELSNLNETEKPIREKYQQEELREKRKAEQEEIENRKARLIREKEIQETLSREGINLEREMYHIDCLENGYMFEEYIANLLKNLGYTNIEVTPSSGDKGADVIANGNGITYAIQCKWRSFGNNVENKAIQEIFSGKAIYNKDVRSSCNKSLLYAISERFSGKTWYYIMG